MENNHYKKPAWTHNGSVRTDLPLTIVSKKKKAVATVAAGQLVCVGEVYLKTKNSLIRIK